KIVGMLAIVVKHGEVQCVYAPKVFCIESLLTTDLRTRLSIEILGETGNHRIKDREARHRQLRAAMLELIAQILVDYREQHHPGLALDLAKDTLELLGRTYQRIDVLDRLVVGIMCHRRACNRVECLTGCIGNQVHMKKTAHPRKVA